MKGGMSDDDRMAARLVIAAEHAWREGYENWGTPVGQLRWDILQAARELFAAHLRLAVIEGRLTEQQLDAVWYQTV